MFQNLDINFLFAELSLISIIFPLLAGTIKRKSLVNYQRTLFWYILIATVTEIISTSLAYQGINNLPLFHLFTVAEFTVLAIYFKQVFQPAGKKPRLEIFIVLFIAFSIINILFLEDIYTFSTNAKSIESLFFIVLSIYYFYTLTNKPPVLYITDYPAFWASAGILIYFGGSLFIFAYSKFIMETLPELHRAAWTVHSVFNIIFNLILAKALWSKHKA